MSKRIILEKLMSKKGNDSKVDNLIKLPILVLWINKKEQSHRETEGVVNLITLKNYLKILIYVFVKNNNKTNNR